MKFFIIVIGVVLIFEGLPWFMSPHGAKRALVQLLRMEDRVLRLVGLAFMLAGLLLVYLVKGWPG